MSTESAITATYAEYHKLYTAWLAVYARTSDAFVHLGAVGTPDADAWSLVRDWYACRPLSSFSVDDLGHTPCECRGAHTGRDLGHNDPRCMIRAEIAASLRSEADLKYADKVNDLITQLYDAGAFFVGSLGPITREFALVSHAHAPAQTLGLPDEAPRIVVTDEAGEHWICYRNKGRIHGYWNDKSLSVPMASMTSFTPETPAERALRDCALMV